MSSHGSRTRDFSATRIPEHRFSQKSKPCRTDWQVRLSSWRKWPVVRRPFFLGIPERDHGVFSGTAGKYFLNRPSSPVTSVQPMISAWAPMKKSGSGAAGASLPDSDFRRLR